MEVGCIEHGSICKTYNEWSSVCFRLYYLLEYFESGCIEHGSICKTYNE